jgi:hypothetical protein
MILSQFVEAAMRPEPHRGAHTQESRGPRWGDKMAQKGDFAGAGSFATASLGRVSTFEASVTDNVMVFIAERVSAKHPIGLCRHPLNCYKFFDLRATPENRNAPALKPS